MSDSLGGVVTGFDALGGRRQFELAFERPLAGPPMAAGEKVLFHTLNSGVINVSIFDPASLRLSAQAPLSAGGHDVGGLYLPPLVWKDRVLYFDARSGAVLAAHMTTGGIERVDVKAAPASARAGASAGEPAASSPSSAPSATSAPAVSAISWTLCGDTLCLVGADGHIRLWRLEVAR